MGFKFYLPRREFEACIFLNNLLFVDKSGENIVLYYGLIDERINNFDKV